MTDYEAVEIAEGFGDGANADDDQRTAAWQHLIDTGLVWKLQGWYGRTATALIEQGVCHAA